MKKIAYWLTMGLTGFVLANPTGGEGAPQNTDAPLTYTALQALIRADYEALGGYLVDLEVFKVPNKADKRQGIFRLLRSNPVPAKVQLNNGDPQITAARNLLAGFRAISDTGSFRLNLAALVQTFDASELPQRYARLVAAEKMFALPEVQSFRTQWTDFGVAWLKLEEDYVAMLANKSPKMAAEKVWLPAHEMTLVDCWNGAHMHQWFDSNLAVQNSAFARTALMLERWGSRISIKYIQDAREAAKQNLERVQKVIVAHDKALKAMDRVEKKAGKLQPVNDIMEIYEILIMDSIKNVDTKIVQIADRLLEKNTLSYLILSERGISSTIAEAVSGGANESRGPQFMKLAKNAVAKARQDIRAQYESSFGRPMLLRPTKPHNVFK